MKSNKKIIMKLNVYSGVLKKPLYKDNYFEKKIWIKKEEKLIKNLIKKNLEPVKKDNLLFYYLSFVRSKKIKILDWGGGFGNIFLI